MKDVPSSFIVVSYVHPVDLRVRSVWICEGEVRYSAKLTLQPR